MRLFVAVAVPSPVATAAAAAIPELPALRSVRPDVMHITLAFLGAVDDARVDEAAAALAEGARGRRAFDVELDAIGRFPSGGAPRVVWLSAGTGAAELVRLAESVRKTLAVHSLPFDDKPFRPHLTLARVREDTDRATARAVAAAVAGARIAPLRFRVDEAILFESKLSPKGPRYTRRAAAPLEVGGTRQ